jgi:hypothetical protein
MRLSSAAQAYYKNLIPKLSRKSVTAEQARHIMGAISNMGDDLSLTSVSVNRIASELKLPEAHKAAIIFAILIQRYGDVFKPALDQPKGKPALTSMGDALLRILRFARSGRGEALREKLAAFFARFAAKDARVADSGVEIFKPRASPTLRVEPGKGSDEVWIAGRRPASTVHDYTFDFDEDGKQQGRLSYDKARDRWVFFRSVRDGSISKRGVPFSQMRDVVLLYGIRDAFRDAGRNAPPTEVRAQDQILNDLLERLAELSNQGKDQGVMNWKTLYFTTDVVHKGPRTGSHSLDHGVFRTEGKDRAWVYRPRVNGRLDAKKDVPLTKLGLRSLHVLRKALLAQTDAGDEMLVETKRQRGVQSPAARLLQEVTQLLEQRSTARMESLKQGEQRLREALAGLTVTPAPQDALNAMVRFLELDRA